MQEKRTKIKFTKEKIERLKKKAKDFSIEELEIFYHNNECEIDRSIRTNEILAEVIKEKKH